MLQKEPCYLQCHSNYFSDRPRAALWPSRESLGAVFLIHHLESFWTSGSGCQSKQLCISGSGLLSVHVPANWTEVFHLMAVMQHSRFLAGKTTGKGDLKKEKWRRRESLPWEPRKRCCSWSLPHALVLGSQSKRCLHTHFGRRPVCTLHTFPHSCGRIRDEMQCLFNGCLAWISEGLRVLLRKKCCQENTLRVLSDSGSDHFYSNKAGSSS